MLVLDERIRARAAEYFSQFDGREVHLRFTPLKGLGSNRLYRCDLSTDDPGIPQAALVIKLAALSKPQRIEFDHLKLLQANRREIPAALAIARPLDFFPDINALVTENVSGEPLTPLLLRKLHRLASPAQREWIASRIRLCGQWLAHYHRLTQAGDAPPFGDRWLDRVTSTIQELTLNGFPRAAAMAAGNTLSRLHEVRTRIPAPHAERHGDFAPYNVSVGDTSICVFDFNDRSIECVYDDLAVFSVWLETVNHWPHYPFFDRRAAVAMKEECLRAYFSESRYAYSDLTLEGYALKQLLSVCRARRRRVSGRAPALLRLFDTLQLRMLFPKRILERCRRVAQLLDSSRLT